MFSIFKGAQIELWRSKITLFFVLLFPSLLIFILGTMLTNLDNPDGAIRPFELAYVIDSDDPVTVRTAETIIEQFADVDQVNFSEGTSLASVERRLEEGELGAVVVFTEPFGIEIHEGSGGTQNRAVRSIFDGVARLYGTISVVMSEMSDSAASAVPAEVGSPAGSGGSVASGASALDAPAMLDTPGAGIAPVDSGALISSALASFDTAPSRVEEKTYGISRTMIDYYAIAMIVMIFFMNSAIGGASTFYSQRKDGTLRRILASPQSRASVYLQMVLQSVPQNLLQVLAAMLISTAFFNAHYAATWQLNVLLFVMLLAVGCAVSSVFLVLGIFIRANPMLVLMPVMWVLLFISGTFSKQIFIPGVTSIMPPYLIQSAAFDLTLFGSIGPSVVVLLVSLALIAISTLLGCVLINRKDVAS
jgi:ABC-2 type transport system permease protein